MSENDAVNTSLTVVQLEVN